MTISLSWWKSIKDIKDKGNHYRLKSPLKSYICKCTLDMVMKILGMCKYEHVQCI